MQPNFGFFEEDSLGEVRDARLWRRIMHYAAPHTLGIALAIVLSLTVIGAGLALPYLTRIAIDRYIVGNTLGRAARLAGLSHLTLAFLLLAGLGFAANFLQVTLLEWLGQNIMHRLRQRLFVHLLQQELAFFNANPAGKLVTRLTNDIQNMNEMFTSVVVTLFNDGVQFVAILGILAAMNWRLALLMAALTPLIAINLTVFSRLARNAFRAIRTRLAGLNAFLQESLSGMGLIQHFRREADTLASFQTQNDDYLAKNLRQIRLFSIFVPLVEVLSSTAIALIIWYGGGLVLRRELSLGELAAFISYMRLFFRPVREMSEKFSIIQSAMASAERIFQLLDLAPALTGGELRLPRLAGQVEMRGVDFAYSEKEPVLKGLNLNIQAGETVAIVGPTGAGKSTIVNLIERLYDPNQGLITLDGHPLAEFDLAWLRGQIGLVMQEVLLVPGTLKDNLCLGETIPEERLAEVVAKAQLREVAKRLPQGLDTTIGEGGHELSTGQKQLLALARVLLKNPGLLILDEATANIDSLTEALVERAIRATARGRTSILIVHRLSTIRDADRIVVLRDGRLIEEGNYQELVERGGVFARLVERQRLA